MSKNSTLAVFAIVSGAFLLSGCDKAEETKANKPATSTAPAAVEKAVEKPIKTVTEAKFEKPAADIKYKMIAATLRDTGEKIQVRVPEGEDTPSGRYLEIRELADGSYEFKSVIPQ